MPEDFLWTFDPSVLARDVEELNSDPMTRQLFRRTLIFQLGLEIGTTKPFGFLTEGEVIRVATTSADRMIEEMGSKVDRKNEIIYQAVAAILREIIAEGSPERIEDVRRHLGEKAVPLYAEVMIGDRMIRYPRLLDFPKASPEGAARITDLETIEITFSYPLSHTVTKTFTNPGGFTAYDFLKAVHDGYADIYREEEEAVGNPGNVPGLLNRASSNGPHGIWGHDMGDLHLEGLHHLGNGVFKLDIGS